MASLTKELPPLPPDPAPEDPHKAHTGVFRRLTSKLRSPSQQWMHAASPHGHNDLDCVQEEPPSPAKKDKHKRRFSGSFGLPAPAAVHRKAGIELENAFTSAEQRQAALRSLGLVPANAKPGRDAHGYKAPLSEQEAQLDKYFATTPAVEEHESEAQKIKEAWLKKNTEAGVEGGSGSGSGSRAASRSPERERISSRSPTPQCESPTMAAEEPKQIEKVEKPLMTTDQVRARRKDDPVFAPSGLLAAMQAYKPENYRPPPGRKPSIASKPQRRAVDQDSDTDSGI